MLLPPSLGEQIACVEREIALRRRVYPRWIESGRLSQRKADIEIAAMEAVLTTVRRYKFLWERDLSTIAEGGVFAGKVPDNHVLNGVTLDDEIDREMRPWPMRART